MNYFKTFYSNYNKINKRAINTSYCHFDYKEFSLINESNIKYRIIFLLKERQIKYIAEFIDIININILEMDKKSIFICDFKNWEKIFTTKYSLMRHSLTHWKNKIYKWKQWDKAFSFKQNLIEHEFIHSGELPYLCGVNGWNERFRQRGKLSLHRQSHQTYHKKEYRSHILINEGEMKQRDQLTQVGEMRVNSNIQTNSSSRNCFQGQVPATTPNRFFINSVCQKFTPMPCANSNVLNFGQGMPNRSYQIIRANVPPINIIARSLQMQYPDDKQLPKLSLVMMPFNQLGCQFN